MSAGSVSKLGRLRRLGTLQQFSYRPSIFRFATEDIARDEFFGTQGTAGITATVAATQANNTATSTGKVYVEGAVSVTQAGNAVSSAGKVYVEATASTAQAGNTVSATAKNYVEAQLTRTQASNTVASTLSVTNPARQVDAALTQAGNAANATASVLVKASASNAQQPNTVTAASTVRVETAVTGTQEGNTVASAAVVAVKGTVSVAQAGQTVSSTGTVTGTTQAGMRSIMAPWLGGTSAVGVTPTVAGVRSLLGVWVGGANGPVTPPSTGGGYKSLLAFWTGGATADAAEIPAEVFRPRGRVRRKTVPEYVLPWITEEVEKEDKKELVRVLNNVQKVIDHGANLKAIEELLRKLDEFIERYLELYQLRTQLITIKQEIERVAQIKHKQRKNQQAAALLLRRF